MAMRRRPARAASVPQVFYQVTITPMCDGHDISTHKVTAATAALLRAVVADLRPGERELIGQAVRALIAARGGDA